MNNWLQVNSLLFQLGILTMGLQLDSLTLKHRRSHLHCSFIPSAVCLPHRGASAFDSLKELNFSIALSKVAHASAVEELKN